MRRIVRRVVGYGVLAALLMAGYFVFVRPPMLASNAVQKAELDWIIRRPGRADVMEAIEYSLGRPGDVDCHGVLSYDYKNLDVLGDMTYEDKGKALHAFRIRGTFTRKVTYGWEDDVNNVVERFTDIEFGIERVEGQWYIADSHVIDDIRGRRVADQAFRDSMMMNRGAQVPATPTRPCE